MSEYLTVQDIMKRLKISRAQAYRLVAKRDFPKIRIGKKIIAAAQDVEDYVQAHKYGEVII